MLEADDEERRGNDAAGAGAGAAAPRGNDDAAVHHVVYEESEADEFASQIMSLMVPVSLCMALVVCFVRVLGQSLDSGFSQVLVYDEQEDDGSGTKLAGALLNMLMFVVLIFVVTSVMVVLYKLRCLWIIYGWLILSCLSLLGVFTMYIATLVLDLYNAPLDLVSFYVLLWNFAVVGVLAIFWHSPLAVKQAYLVVMSAMMAWTLTKLPDWTTWGILTGVSLWDLFAVLSPVGPLKALLDESQTRQEPIPGLVYETSQNTAVERAARRAGQAAAPPSPAAPQPHPDDSHESNSHSRLLDDQQDVPEQQPDEEPHRAVQLQPLHHDPPRESQKSRLPREQQQQRHHHHQQRVSEQQRTEPHAQPSQQPQQRAQRQNRHEEGPRPATPQQSRQHGRGESPAVAAAAAAERDARARESEAVQGRGRERFHEHPEDDDDDEEHSVKLGLGDFIFYSVLLARAAMLDTWPTIVTCFLALLTGLCLTLFFLAYLQKPLPALPMSIGLGIVFYFATSVVVDPYLKELLTRQVFV